MKLHVVSNSEGKIVAAMRLLEDGPVRIGLRAREKQYLHEVEVPLSLHGLTHAEMARRLVVKTIGKAPAFNLDVEKKGP
ncbi:MAG TPA: hypothetical protein VMF56_05670 [Acidobacteriaceae bacterium]|nr:hypothetical protein [Acidobacteriaceae bacterium]